MKLIMRYVIIKTSKGFKLIDSSKGCYVRQEKYIIDDESGIIVGTVEHEFIDPIEAINELLILQMEIMKNNILVEVENERYS